VYVAVVLLFFSYIFTSKDARALQREVQLFCIVFIDDLQLENLSSKCVVFNALTQ
jgi:hypothetical protein